MDLWHLCNGNTVLSEALNVFKRGIFNCQLNSEKTTLKTWHNSTQTASKYVCKPTWHCLQTVQFLEEIARIKIFFYCWWVAKCFVDHLGRERHFKHLLSNNNNFITPCFTPRWWRHHKINMSKTPTRLHHILILLESTYHYSYLE